MEPPIFVTVHKNGSSYAVVIPKDILRVLKIERGDQLMVSATSAGVVQYHKISDDARLKIIED